MFKQIQTAMKVRSEAAHSYNKILAQYQSARCAAREDELESSQLGGVGMSIDLECAADDLAPRVQEAKANLTQARQDHNIGFILAYHLSPYTPTSG